MNTPWLWFWLLAFGGIFAAGETITVHRVQKGDTLSENVYAITKRVPFGGYLLTLGMLWLAWHFTRGHGHRWDFWNEDTR